MNDAGCNPDHIGQAAFVDPIHSDTAHYGPGLLQRGIRVERYERNAPDYFFRK
jgi:hypothetical protein